MSSRPWRRPISISQRTIPAERSDSLSRLRRPARRASPVICGTSAMGPVRPKAQQRSTRIKTREPTTCRLRLRTYRAYLARLSNATTSRSSGRPLRTSRVSRGSVNSRKTPEPGNTISRLYSQICPWAALAMHPQGGSGPSATGPRARNRTPCTATRKRAYTPCR